MPFATAAAAALVTALAAGPASAPAAPAGEALGRAPDLGIHPWRELPAPSGPAPSSPAGAAAPPCLGEVCQPRVSVPGFDTGYSRASRTELAVAYLERARLEPFATIGWALLATGLRLDYSPPSFEGASRAPQHWGTFFVRVKFRVDADNVPVVPPRHPADARPGSS